MTFMAHRCLVFAFCALIPVYGCVAPAQPGGPTAVLMTLPDRDAFLDATLTTLRRYDLEPERVDRVAGEVVTHPTTSAQWFEFWRRDALGLYQGLEASLHTIQRVVSVRATPTEQAPDEYEVSVEVQKSRYGAAERQVTSASGALAIYSQQLPTVEGRRGREAGGAYWAPLGRDAALEEFLLDELSRTAAHAPVSAEPS